MEKCIRVKPLDLRGLVQGFDSIGFLQSSQVGKIQSSRVRKKYQVKPSQQAKPSQQVKPSRVKTLV